MATSKKGAKKTAKRTSRATRASAKKTARKATRKTKPAKRAASTETIVGAIAHTELASADPAATKQWAAKALGWKTMPAMPMPDGDYHMWEGGDGESGGIRAAAPPETPGTIVYVAVANIQRAYQKALREGATPMLPPQDIGGGMGKMAIVNAPGGVAIGLWAQA